MKMKAFRTLLATAALVSLTSVLGGTAFAACPVGQICLPPPPPADVVNGIKAKYASMGGSTGVLGPATSALRWTSDGKGYYQTFQYGAIYWTQATGVHETHGEIWKKYIALGGPAALGYPLTDERPIPGYSCTGCYGRFNKFQRGDIYYTTDAGAVAVPDRAGDIVTHKLSPQIGIQPMLTIIWNPHYDPNSTTDPLPKGQYSSFRNNIERRLFGDDPSVADWYYENSNEKLTLVNVGILGPYEALKKPGSHYWNDEYHKVNNDGWKSGHDEKYAEAILRAAQDFDFASYDDNRDGVLTADELAIAIVIPAAGEGGYARPIVGRQYPSDAPFKLGGTHGLQINSILEWYAPNTGKLNLGLPVHELAHLIINAPDLYFDEWRPYAAERYSIMDATWTATHFDPFIKLKSGWLSYTAAIGSGDYTLRDVETSGQILVLYDLQRSPREYFIIENRFRGTSYDAGRCVDNSGYSYYVGPCVPDKPYSVGDGLPKDGIAIWHIIEDPALYPDSRGEWGRQGLRLIRADGPKGPACKKVQRQVCVPTKPGAPPICRIVWEQVCVPPEPVDDAKAMLSHIGDWISATDARRAGTPSPARLRWIDGSPSGFKVELKSAPGSSVQVGITIER